MIGLVDYDFCSSKSVIKLIPNLEIMKLASYYRIEENKFCRLLSLDEESLDNYDKIYFFSESDTYPQIPDNFKRANNVIYGGTAFTNKQYIPFENSLIDFTLPRTFIYKDFLKEKYDAGVKSANITKMLDSTYYRNYAGKDKLPLPAIKPRKRIILYDRDFFYPDWEETIKIISNRVPASIIRIHPIYCTTLGQFFKLRSYEKISHDNQVVLDIDVPFSEIPYMMKHYKKLFLAEIVSSSKVYLPLGGNLKTNTQYFKDLIYKLNLLYSFWSCGIIIKIRYENPSIGYHNPIENLSRLIATWSTCNPAYKSREKTLNERIIRKSGVSIEQQERDFVLKFFPECKELFEQCFDKLKERGVWRV